MKVQLPHPRILLSITACTFAVLQGAQAETYVSTATGGDFYTDGTWTTSGYPVSDSGDDFVVSTGATVRLDGYFRNNTGAGSIMQEDSNLIIGDGGVLEFTGGAVGNRQILSFDGNSIVTIENGGTYFTGRASINTPDAKVVFDISGNYTAGSGATTYNFATGSEFEFNIKSGGTYLHKGADFDLGTVVVNVQGGTFKYRPGTTGGHTILTKDSNAVWFNVSAGTMDFGGLSWKWNPSNPNGGLQWTGGTVVNMYALTVENASTLRDDIFSGFGTDAGQVIDINNQELDDIAEQWAVEDGVLSADMGTIQFDVYGDLSSDSISFTTGTVDLGEQVMIAIGYVGGEISDPSSLVGQQLDLITGLSDFSNIAATVGKAYWNDGENVWEVIFSSNLASDGSVTISSITLVPEASTKSMLFVAVFLFVGFLINKARRAKAA